MTSPRLTERRQTNCKMITRNKISAIAGLETERGIISNGVNLSAEFNATTGLISV